MSFLELAADRLDCEATPSWDARNIGRIGAFVVVSSHLLGCQTCTDVGCGTQQTFTIHAADGNLPKGEYQVAVSDWQTSVTVSCSVQPPPAPSGCSNEARAHLETNAQGVSAIVVTTSGSVGFGVSRDGVPQKVTRVSSVRVYHPNGPDCDPECDVLTEDVTLN